MRAWCGGLLIVLAALVAAPAASAQDPATPTPTPSPTATPTPTPTPTPEEVAETERKEKLQKRKVVRRVYKDYEDGRIDTCDHSRLALKRTLQSITDEVDTDFPDFRVAVKAAIKDHDAERCVQEQEQEQAQDTPAPAPSASPPTTTPAPTSPPPTTTTPAPSTDSGDVPDLGGGGGGGGGSGAGRGGSKPPAVDTSPAPTEGDVTPVQPPATPAPTTPVTPAAPQMAIVRPDGDSNLLVPAILLAAALAGLALLAATPFAARRSDRLAGWSHSVREASYRATGAWGDFGDWLRLGR
jgi:hypothetical protein